MLEVFEDARPLLRKRARCRLRRDRELDALAANRGDFADLRARRVDHRGAYVAREITVGACDIDSPLRECAFVRRSEELARVVVISARDGESDLVDPAYALYG
jgi:hypothetical protein